MGNYTNKALTESRIKVLTLQVKVESLDAEKSISNDLVKERNNLEEINKFHNEYKSDSEKLFANLEKSFKNLSSRLIGDYSIFSARGGLYRDSFKSLQQGLEKGIKEIKDKNISSLIPDKFKNDDKVIWQYRYALLIAFLDQYIKSDETKKMVVLQDYLNNARQVLTATKIESEDQLIAEAEDEITYQALYAEALKKEILTKNSINENLQIIEDKYKKSKEKDFQVMSDDKSKTEKAKALAEKSLKLYNAELGKLKTKHVLQGSREGVIKDLIDSADHFIGKSLNIRSTLTEEMAAEVLGDATLMLRHFNLCLNPSLSEKRKVNEKIVFESADRLSRNVEMNKNSKNEKLVATVLLVIGLVLLALGIIAAIAASHGVFLGLIPFATTKAVIATCGPAMGTTFLINTQAMKGCLLAATWGIAGGTMLTGIGIGSFFNKNEVKEKGRAFSEAAKKAATEEGNNPIAKGKSLNK